MSEKSNPVQLYLKIFLILMGLTFLTVGSAYLNFGRFNLFIALTIAGIKAALVVLFFMHVSGSKHLIKLTIVSGVFWLFLLIGITLSDYYFRQHPVIPNDTTWILTNPSHYHPKKLGPKNTSSHSAAH